MKVKTVYKNPHKLDRRKLADALLQISVPGYEVANLQVSWFCSAYASILGSSPAENTNNLQCFVCDCYIHVPVEHYVSNLVRVWASCVVRLNNGPNRIACKACIPAIAKILEMPNFLEHDEYFSNGHSLLRFIKELELIGLKPPYTELILPGTVEQRRSLLRILELRKAKLI